MKTVKAKSGTYKCEAGHECNEALLLEGMGGQWDGIYCLPCFNWTLVHRLAIRRCELVLPPPVAEPEPVEPESVGEPVQHEYPVDETPPTEQPEEAPSDEETEDPGAGEEPAAE